MIEATRPGPALAVRTRSAPVERDYELAPFDYAKARALSEALGLAEPVAATLVRRGHDTPEAARAFLAAEQSHDAFGFEAMPVVVARIRAAIGAGKRITVHGDYDVDGVCSTAIVVSTLRELGGECDWFIPDRLGSGYGLSSEGVGTLVARGTELLVTVDCGITCAPEVARAAELGIEVVVTDHHEPGETLPGCPILHPRVSGYAFGELCGTGVAYKLACALVGEAEAARQLDLVALATVADLVPLRGENRSLVRRGIAVARRARRPGLRALMAVSRLNPERLDETDMAFRLAPRINAAGRLYRADAGVELMLTTDEARAEAIAAELDRANHERRATERGVLEEAERALRELAPELADAPGLVLAGEGWHPGVVGIVASRLAEKHCKPVVLIAIDDEGRGRGSGRSIPGFDLLAGLRACSEQLDRFGGHRAAAGLELTAERIPEFRAAFVAHVSSELGDERQVLSERVDAVVGGESLTLDVAEQFASLGPFGKGNPPVRLLVPSARLAEVRPMGQEGRHARFTLISGARRAPGVAFGVDGSLERDSQKGPADVSLALEIDEWNGTVSPRVVLGELYGETDVPSPLRAEPGNPEFWRRVDAERIADLSPLAGARLGPVPASGRRVIDARGTSGLARIASLASTGRCVLVLCADAVRRRALVERALRPSLCSGSSNVLVSARLASAPGVAALEELRATGRGVALLDWGALSADPGIAHGFEHVVLLDPPPFARLEHWALDGEGWAHLAWGPIEADLAGRVHAAEWPDRDTLAAAYRDLRDAVGPAGSVSSERARRALCGPGLAHPRCPEVAGRILRVLEELKLVACEEAAPARTLRVLSSGGTSLERSRAYVAYRQRREEGARCLSDRRPKTS